MRRFIFVVAPPSTRKGTLARSLGGHNNWIFMDEWMCGMTLKWIKSNAASRDFICTTTPFRMEEILNSSEYKVIQELFHVSRLDLSHLTNHLFP